MEFLGIALNQSLNYKTKGVEADISVSDSKVKVLVVPTNEEQIIIEDTIRVAGYEEVLSSPTRRSENI